MLVKARVTEAVVVVIVPQVGNNVIFQPAVGGPYTLIAHRPRFCCGVRFVSGSFVWLCGVGLISARARDFIEVGARRGLWAFAREASEYF